MSITTINIRTIAAGTTYISPSFRVPRGKAFMEDIILALIDKTFWDVTLHLLLITDNSARMAIFDGTGALLNEGNNVTVKILVVNNNARLLIPVHHFFILATYIWIHIHLMMDAIKGKQ